jgi:hypothetical protein
MKTTITLSEDDALVFRLLKVKTGYTLEELMHMLTTAIKTVMVDGIDEKAQRLNFGVFANLKNSMVEIRFSPLYIGLDNLTNEQQKEVLTAFGYSTDGRFKDLREKDPEKEEANGQ